MAGSSNVNKKPVEVSDSNVAVFGPYQGSLTSPFQLNFGSLERAIVIEKGAFQQNTPATGTGANNLVIYRRALVDVGNTGAVASGRDVFASINVGTGGSSPVGAANTRNNLTLATGTGGTPDENVIAPGDTLTVAMSAPAGMVDGVLMIKWKYQEP